MPIRDNREYRLVSSFGVEERRAGEDKERYIVSGYASTFDPYVLYEDGGITVSERVEPTAFDGTDFSDVIMQYDHGGMVYARTANHTLELGVDEHGLKVRADLSSTTQSREMYEAIAAGLVTKMSFAFTVDAEDYDEKSNTRIIRHVRKLYDVSAVSSPANTGTEIGVGVRDAVNGAIEARKQARRREEAKKRLEEKLRDMGVRKDD